MVHVLSEITEFKGERLVVQCDVCTLSHKTCLENRLSFACSDICVLATEPNKQTEQINIFCSDSETIHQRDYLLLT